MNTRKDLPVWYDDSIGNNCNALWGVGHLTHAGSYFLNPKIMNAQKNIQENKIQTLEVSFDNYAEVLVIVRSLVNTCKNSLRHEHRSDYSEINDNCLDVANVLELTEKLLPTTNNSGSLNH
ncbi:hypothetical protein [Flavobacterium sp. '19STA2R22 D10 B1']|uniref:hypothetical protein n=1 Tax=Flavobacterium aerium TaxID=3037261 RepID=UPI00278C7008|nr:hypothetical protein [Flavobacterium sp. '19STA2R22 D10 B1']